MELAWTMSLGGVCLLSSDGDFAHVAARLRARGLDVRVIGQPSAARSLRRAAGSFHPIPPLLAPTLH